MTDTQAGRDAAATAAPTVGVVAESGADERRVALVPKAVSALVGSGVAVVVETGAGDRALLTDDLYTAAGATIGDAWAADIVVKVAPPTAAEVARLRPGQTLVGFLAPRNADNQIDALKAAGVQAFAVEAIPRISRAQVMDALSSQANVAGYKAVLLAASESTRFFPMLTTAAGTVKPASLLVLGVGVAGLQAIATARRLGAMVKAYDVRSDTKEQAESLGAQFVTLKSAIEATGQGGYARALTAEEQAAQQSELNGIIANSDIVITTAQVPGRRPPVLVTKAAVEGMKTGSIIVDMAASELGGNCELSRPGKVVASANGVEIHAPLNLPSSMPTGASIFYSRNISNLLLNVVSDGAIHLDFDDEVTAATVITNGGKVVQPATLKLLQPAPKGGAQA